MPSTKSYAGERLGILDLEPGRIVGHVLEREGRVFVGTERAVALEADAPRPAQDADVEIEEPSRVAAGEEDREQGDHAHAEERDPEEQEHDEVRNRQQPLDEPEPAAQPL
jgi:hypothetical protein